MWITEGEELSASAFIGKDLELNKLNENCEGFGFIFKTCQRLNSLRIRPLVARQKMDQKTSKMGCSLTEIALIQL